MKVAVVTGASRGLGKEIALTLGRSGYNVAVNYLSSEAEARKVAGAIGRNAILVRADVGYLKQVENISDIIYRQWGRVDVVVNNAGIVRDSLLLKTKEQDWDEVIRINLKGCFNVIKVFSCAMMKSGGGHIINISSYSGKKGQEGQAAYSASKAATLGLTCTAAKELAEYNIKVNAILPGYMQTEMGNSAGKAMEKAKAESLTGGLSDPVQAAEFISYLIKTENITGQVFSLDSRII